MWFILSAVLVGALFEAVHINPKFWPNWKLSGSTLMFNTNNYNIYDLLSSKVNADLVEWPSCNIITDWNLSTELTLVFYAIEYFW